MRSVEDILRESRIIAMVGLSPNPERYSYRTAQYLQEQGYRVIPVNPSAAEILGERCYADLSQVSEKVDLVYIIRNSRDVPPIVDQAVAMGAKVVWMHEEVSHDEAGQKAQMSGLDVVMDR